MDGMPEDEAPKECVYKNSKKYPDGSKFKDGCVACVCVNGQITCDETACENAPCFHNNVRHEHGTSFWDGCKECVCNDGEFFCTEDSCAEDSVELSCPELPEGTFGICVEACDSSDPTSCPDENQLCCSNGCGHVCTVGVAIEQGAPDTNDFL